LRSITLNVETERFAFPLQIPIETEQLKEMLDNKDISATGKITIGQKEEKLTKTIGKIVKILQKSEYK